MSRRYSAFFFLALVLFAILWPAIAGALPRASCCKSRTSACGIPATGFSLCCFHSASILPGLPPAGVASVRIFRFSPADEIGGPSPFPRDILHIPLALLT